MRSVVELDDGIAGQIAGVNPGVGYGVVEHPSNVRMKQPFERGFVNAMAVYERAVVIAAVVCVGVMPSVIRHPGEQRTLKRHGAGCPEQVGEPWLCLKALVGEVAMKADARTHADNKVADDEGHGYNDMNWVRAEPEYTGD